MTDFQDLIKKRLESYFEPHGSMADFCRRTGIPRQNVKNWLKGTAIPLDALEPIAAGLGLAGGWELLRPPNAQLQETAPKLVRSSLLGDAVSLLAAMDDAALAAVLRYLRALK